MPTDRRSRNDTVRAAFFAVGGKAINAVANGAEVLLGGTSAAVVVGTTATATRSDRRRGRGGRSSASVRGLRLWKEQWGFPTEGAAVARGGAMAVLLLVLAIGSVNRINR